MTPDLVDCIKVGDGVLDDLPPDTRAKVTATIHELRSIVERDKAVGLLALGLVLQKLQLLEEDHRA